GFYLPEIWIDRGRERQVRRDPVAQVHADVAQRVVRLVERVPRIPRRAGEPGHGVRHHFEAARGAEPGQAVQLARVGDETAHVGQDRGPPSRLAVPRDLATEVDPPDQVAAVVPAEAELRARDPEPGG